MGTGCQIAWLCQCGVGAAGPGRGRCKTAAGNAALSQRSAGEKEFLEQLARGYAYKQIADRMEIGIDTVRSYVRTVMRNCTSTPAPKPS
jgi:DNA-binding CsgD family transcriptional regulator